MPAGAKKEGEGEGADPFERLGPKPESRSTNMEAPRRRRGVWVSARSFSDPTLSQCNSLGSALAPLSDSNEDAMAYHTTSINL